MSKKSDPLDVVRQSRIQMSHEANNDPSRLIAILRKKEIKYAGQIDKYKLSIESVAEGKMEYETSGIVENKPLRIAVLGSGKGSNCQAIIDAIEKNELNAEIVCVISDVEDAYILERAKKHNIPAKYISAAPFKTKLDGVAEENYIAELKQAGTEVVVLAGFMRIIKQGMLSAFPERILNIHPALLPAFPGVESWKQALDYGVKIAGCTVHYVDAGIDSGPIIVQRAVPVLDDDTPESLHARIQEEEYKAYPEALKIVMRKIREAML